LTPGCCLAGMEEFRVKFSAPDMMLPSLIHKSIPALTALSHQTPPTTPQAFDKLIQSMVTDDNLKSNIYISCWQSAGDFGSHAHITGLASTSDSSARLEAHRRIKQTLDRIVRGTGVTYEFWTSFSNPPMFNDAALTQQIRPFVEEVIGVEKVAWFNAPYPFAHEDFALFAAQVPAVFMWLGTANAELGIHSLLHTSNFDIDESALLTGTAVMAYLLLKLSYQLSE
jgi:metal-dependent amidase/aminoacylase/carboxypeptidase family protein